MSTRVANRLANMARMQSDLSGQGSAKPRTGIVSSYDPNRHAVKVKIQPEDVELVGWIPVSAPGVGNGFGVLVGPNIGDMVQITFNEGNERAPRVTARFFSNANPPVIVQSGETWMVHKSGSTVKLTNDGKVTLIDKAGSTVVMNGDGSGVMTFSGGLTLNGTLLVTKTITGQGGIQISGNNGTGSASTLTGNFTIVGDISSTGAIVNNGHHVDSTHYHSNGNGGSNTGEVVN
ncbi:phage baseplate assembly protein V [Burkholderia sp. BCC0322]|uniref:phage baseplate assembly protein V n=1 Tax=unclassified Burkholderia TaxID=2613784 RepID=UPI00158D2CB9|nr:phage baseplate assembly protein V [Burkholderia sp. BCC0322]